MTPGGIPDTGVPPTQKRNQIMKGLLAIRQMALILLLLAISNLQAQNMSDAWWHTDSDSARSIHTDSMQLFIRSHQLKPARTVRTAVIDGGFWCDHPFIQATLTDTLGWNFLGNASGQSFDRAGTEAFREFKRLYPKYKHTTDASTVADTAEYAHYKQMAREIHIQSYLLMAMNQAYTWQAVSFVDSLMKKAYPGQSPTLEQLFEIDIKDTTGITAPLEVTLTHCLRYGKETPWDSIVERLRHDYELSSKRVASLDTDDDPHHKLGNDFLDFAHLHYGNTHTEGTPYHGTMVCGLIADMMGMADAKGQLIPIRAIPDGDEYDRDVKAALHYAVDQGAKVVNMSFGKYHSPHAEEVQEAIAYALEHDVLLVMSAGNFGTDNDLRPIHPRPFNPKDGQRWPHMLVVAASDHSGQRAGMSCYGQASVDLMAPGIGITSCCDNGSYDIQNGTSLSAPIVAGLAMAIRSYFPDLKAADVKRVILATAADSLVDAGRAFTRAWKESRYGDGLFLQAERMNRLPIDSLMPGRTLQADGLQGHPRYLYYARQEENTEGTVHYLFDLKKRTPIRLFARKDMKYLSDLHITADGHALAFRWKREPMQYDWHTQKLTASTDTLPTRKEHTLRRADYSRNYSADSLFYMSARGHDLWLFDIRSGDSTRLSADGVHYNSFAMGGSSTTDRIKAGQPSSPIGQWIGRTHRYLAVREDKRSVGTLTLVNSLSHPRPTAETYKFAMPGDTAVSHFRTYLVDADTRTMQELQLTRRADDIIDLPRLGRLKQEGNSAWVLQKTRYQDTVTLWRIDAEKGEARPVITECTPPHLCEQLFNFQPILGGKEVIWWSERNGRGQYYLYDGEGRLKHTLTPPDMVAGQIVRIDTAARRIIMEGYGRENPDYSPSYRYYYSVRLDGKGVTCLTPLPGDHEIQADRDGRWLLDHCSRMDMPPVHTLYDMKGHALSTLAVCSDSALRKAGRNLPQVVRVTAADGRTPLWGLVYTPWWMQTGDRLPIISNPYPGPHTDLIPENFQMEEGGNQLLSDLGFVVISFSYRGSTPLRGHDFYTHGYQNLRDYALADDMTTIRQVARMIPQADTTRVGIYGHSGGGFMATAALLTHPDFYRVAVAASGNHDNNIYLKWWGETFHGRGPIPTNMELAPRLEGRLLLIHGDMDNNVHPASTLRMADALIRAGKRFDMLILPGKDHGLGDRYYENTINYYMLEHLAGRRMNHTDILHHQ